VEAVKNIRSAAGKNYFIFQENQQKLRTAIPRKPGPEVSKFRLRQPPTTIAFHAVREGPFFVVKVLSTAVVGWKINYSRWLRSFVSMLPPTQ